jgi:two-component system NarL family response regulator
VRARDPTARILIMTTYDGEHDILECMSRGAKGYLLKDAPRQQILTAIRTVSQGASFAAPAAGNVLQQPAKPVLTQRQLAVLQLVARGCSNKDIARQLSISEGTAKTYVRAILIELDAMSRTEAVVLAHKRGMICLDTCSADP